jgi:RNase P subunit RPR2
MGEVPPRAGPPPFPAKATAPCPECETISPCVEWERLRHHEQGRIVLVVHVCGNCGCRFRADYREEELAWD